MPTSADCVNESERLFAAFGQQSRFQLHRIPTADALGHQRPDYMVRSRGRRARRVLVEVKQVGPSRAEQPMVREFERTGRVEMQGTPGERIRNAIKKAGPQLRAMNDGRGPALIVIYDAYPLGSSLHTDPYSVLTAMRGLDVIDVQVPRDPSAPPIWGALRPGPGRRMTPTANTSISGIALLRHDGPRALRLDVFHNRFAAVPLRLVDLAGGRVRHFRMRRDLNDWEPVPGAAG